jgi:hypothetical protein
MYNWANLVTSRGGECQLEHHFLNLLKLYQRDEDETSRRVDPDTADCLVPGTQPCAFRSIRRSRCRIHGNPSWYQ